MLFTNIWSVANVCEEIEPMAQFLHSRENVQVFRNSITQADSHAQIRARMTDNRGELRDEGVGECVNR